jgi:hypothetical protein
MSRRRKADKMDKQATEQTTPIPIDYIAALEKKNKSTKKKKGSSTTATTTAVEQLESSSDLAIESSELPQKPSSPEEAEREARAEAARQRMEARPEVSTILVDAESGMEMVAQGKNVMDVVTRKAVQLSTLGPQYRLAQMLPGIPADVRAKYRFDWQTIEVPEMVAALKQACMVKLADSNGSSSRYGIPPHPSVANKAIDFVLANRDLLGYKMKHTLGRLTMRAMSLGNIEEGKEYQALWKNFLTLENHISAPFRQMILDGEGRVGPNFGNLDVQSYCNGPLYERCANYLVLKGMVAHWEKKVVDADYTEKTLQNKDNYVSVMARGDPRRYLPDPPILFTLKECTQVCYMAQQMTKTFVETPALFDDLPPEIRFLEYALTIKGGTPLRKFMIEEFCPAEGITPAGLREGMRRLLQQLDNLQTDPYGDLFNIMERLIKAMEVGSDDGARDPYAVYLANKDRNGPGAFQTYTFNHDQLSLVRFLDSQYVREGATGEGKSAPLGGGSGGGSNDGGFGGLFNFGGMGGIGGIGGGGGGGGPTAAAQPARTEPNGKTQAPYKVPDVRAVGRPHELGWLELLKEPSSTGSSNRLGKVPPGRIIPDD